MKQTLEEMNQKKPVRALLTEGLIRRLDEEARHRTCSRNLLIRQACEKLLNEQELKEQRERAA